MQTCKSLCVMLMFSIEGWRKKTKIWYSGLVAFPQRVLWWDAAGCVFKNILGSMEQIRLYCWLCSVRNTRLNVSSHKVIASCTVPNELERKEKSPQTMLNVDFNSHVASKSEFPLPAITIIIRLFVCMRMLLLVCIWGLVKKCILCPLEQRGKRGAISYCFSVFLNCTDAMFCRVVFYSCWRQSGSSYFYPSVLPPSFSRSHSEKIGYNLELPVCCACRSTRW